MKRILEKSLLAIASIAISSQVLGDCDEGTKDIIRKSDGNREAAIAQTKKMVLFHKNNKSGPFWTSTKSQKEREEMFAALEENANEIINNIRSCTDRDLASITPKAKIPQSGSAASNCPAQIEIAQHIRTPDKPGVDQVLHQTYVVLPNGKVGFRYGKEPFGEFGSLELAVEHFSGDNMGEHRPVAAWARCHLAARKEGGVSASSGATSTQAEPPPNCPPKYLEEFKSMGGKGAWLKSMRSVQNQAKQALRTGVWSDGKKLSKDRLEQIRNDVQEIENEISEASACSLPESTSVTSASMKGSQSGGTASNCQKEVRITYPTGQFGSYYDATFQYVGGPDYEVTWHPSGQLDKGFLGKSLQELIEFGEADQSSPEVNFEWRKVAAWARCHVAARNGMAGSAGTASTQAGPQVGNASEVSGQRPNRKNAFNPSSLQGPSAQSQSGSSDGGCKSGDPSCAIRGCNRSGGKAITYRNTAGCGVVSCRFADTKYDWSSVYNNIPGSGCVDSTK